VVKEFLVIARFPDGENSNFPITAIHTVMRKFIVYEIRNTKTNHVYIGVSGSSWCKRISDHLSQLKNKKHPSKKFQLFWDESNGIVDWSFRVLVCDIDGFCQARKEETVILGETSEDLILNAKKKTGVGWDKIAQVKNLKKQGAALKEISELANVSMSTASKIINNYPQFSR